jgi:hypothetical protein
MLRAYCLLIALISLRLAGCAPEAKAPATVPPMQQPVSTASIPATAPQTRTEPGSPASIAPKQQAAPAIPHPPVQRQAAPAPGPPPTAKREIQQVRPTELPDAAIVALIIKASLGSYPGNCPCPYNTDRAGRSCGRRSAYSRPGGRSPICYPNDVTPAMIEAYRRNQASARAR